VSLDPVSTWRVPLSDLAVDDELLDAVRDVVATGWWSMGATVEEFERRFAEATGTAHAMAVANGTAALHLALLAAGCGPGDEVIVPSLTFVAAANTVVFCGATPVFCDIRGPHDLNLDPDDVEAAVTPATKAIMAMHYGGFPCDMDAIRAIAERHGLAVIEDAAHAPGAAQGGRPCGSLGDIGCFSFFANKNLATGEGGMVVTDDDDLAASVRLLRSHGMTSLTWDRHRGHAHSYDVVAPGLNYRLDEIHAAIGLVELARLPERNRRRGDAWRAYRDGLASTAVTVPFCETDERATPSYHLAVVVLPDGVARDGVQERLRERAIQTSVHYPPIHGFSAYRDLGARRPLPQTERVADRLLTLPLFPQMTAEQQAEVIAGLRDATGAG
jgi:dTDP-4-amino-4,6-dideoxygalactose transaminase